MSRSLIIGLAVTIAIILGLAVFFYTSFIRVSNRPALEAVPENAAVVLEMDNLPQTWATIYNTDIWKDLKQNESIKQLNNLLIRMDSAVNTNPDVHAFISDNHSTISFHSNRGEHLSILAVLETGTYSDITGFVNWVAKIQNGEITKRIFDKETVYEVLDDRKTPILSIALKDQLLMVSQDGTLVEEAIQKLKYKHRTTFVFEQASKLDLDGSDFGVYLNYQQLPHLLALANKPEYKDLQGPLKLFANWSVLKVSLSKEHFDMNGVTFTDDSLFQFLDLFKAQAPLENDLSHLIPANTALSLQLNMSNYAQFANDLTEYLQNTGRIDDYAAYVDSIEELYHISIFEKLLPHIGPTAMIGLHESAASDVGSQVFGLLQFKNTSAVEEIFNAYAKAIGQKGEADSAIAPYKQYQVKRLQLGNVFKRFFGQTFEQLRSPYYVVKDNVFIMANEWSTLIFILDELDQHKTLGASDAYKQHRRHTVTSSNLNVFISPGKNISYASAFANDETFSALSKYAYDIKKFEFVEIQYANSSNSTFFTNVNISFNPAFKEETKRLWATKLDTLFDAQPTIVFNSLLQQNCIMVQDVNHTLYYLNYAGAILWRTQLQGKIRSEIFQVDVNKTGELSYLFSTDHQAYILSANGNALPGFPLRFPGTATAGINLVDVYGDSTYQFFVPLDSKRIMGYSLYGKPVQGWNPKRTDVAIQTRLSAFRLATGPYLIASGNDNGLWVSGYTSKQTTPEKMFGVSGSYPVFVFQSDTQQVDIWVTDTSGHFVLYTLNNQFRFTPKYNIPTAPEDLSHWIIQTSGGYSLLASHHLGFTVFTDKGQKVISKVYADTSHTLPFYTYNKDYSPMVGYTERSTATIHLIDLQGNTYPTLPVSGTTPFITGDVMLNNTNYLVCGDSLNNILLYRLK
jgi:hypothetical protein